MLRAPASTEVTHEKSGVLEIWLAAPGVVVQRVSGHAGLKIAQAIVRFNDDLISRGVEPYMFDDWMELTGYTTEARQALTTWTRQRLPSIRGVHVLVKSKLVAMGVALSNTAIGGSIQSYSDRTEFEQALDEAIAVASRSALSLG